VNVRRRFSNSVLVQCTLFVKYGEIFVQQLGVCVVCERIYTTLKMSSLSALLRLILFPLAARGWGEYS
jgi:hypothetical protein